MCELEFMLTAVSPRKCLQAENSRLSLRVQGAGEAEVSYT